MALPNADPEARRIVTKALERQYVHLAEAWSQRWPGPRTDALEDAGLAVVEALESAGWKLVRE